MTPTPHRIRTTTAVVALLAAAALAGPPTVSAATTPEVDGTTLTLTGDDAPDRVVIGEDAAGLLTMAINGGTATTDFGGTTLPANNTIDLVADAGGGDDEITITTANLKSVTADGGAGDDVLTGNNDADALSGGDGEDRIVGARGGDAMSGGAGNDVLVWNNGDGSDVMNGDGNADEIEVNGAPTQGDDFTIKPNPADATRVRFDRINLGTFNLDISAERITVNALGGDDKLTAETGLAPLITVTANGAAGADTLTGGDGADLLNGGDDNDTLSGGAGNDRLVGDRGADTMNGGDGEDTTVWNNGDGSDVMNGEAGTDRVEVNGANTAETFTLAPNGARAKFDRTSAGAFSLDIGSAEALDLRALAGDDAFTVSPGTGALLAVTADAGAGNDTLTGAEETDTFSGGTGNDTLTGGNGPDLLDGQEGDDVLRARDGQVRPRARRRRHRLRPDRRRGHGRHGLRRGPRRRRGDPAAAGRREGHRRARALPHRRREDPPRPRDHAPVDRVPGRGGRWLHRHRDADHRQDGEDRLAAGGRRARQRALLAEGRPAQDRHGRAPQGRAQARRQAGDRRPRADRDP